MKLNCLIVALKLWIKSKGRWILGTRRSESFKGMIPHFVVIREKEQGCSLIDYIPQERKTKVLDDGDSLCLFDGVYRIREYSLTKETLTPSLKEFNNILPEKGGKNE